ncbi:hypothetical protein [Vibrio harveyi]|uniref:hypothetical protein n=1 Tax=Vibrio harveyi TaxID=669 RepID=UPI0023806E01|nr:hypothetical protein [Vibrio harveyi]MDF4720570.1 hypothetical protein [Vibrio parahaemolyticus]
MLGDKMIKQPPYKVEFGQSGDVPPAHVVAIDKTSIKLSKNSRDGGKGGSTDELHLNGGLESEETKQIMLELNKQGFVFAYDDKAYISPSHFMKQLLLSGDLRTSFKEISWSSPKQWCLTEYEFEQRT